MTDKPIVRFLKNGDKRSIAGVSRAVSLIGKNPDSRLVFDELKVSFNCADLNILQLITGTFQPFC